MSVDKARQIQEMEDSMEEVLEVLLRPGAVVVVEEEQISELQQEILPQGWLLQVAEAVHMARALQLAVMEGIHLVFQLLEQLVLYMATEVGDPKHLEEWVELLAAAME